MGWCFLAVSLPFLAARATVNSAAARKKTLKSSAITRLAFYDASAESAAVCLSASHRSQSTPVGSCTLRIGHLQPGAERGFQAAE